jgi:lysine-ketoglutarate reductase/saccharopine dehydrogenase-like protein (TIGR00300 family)
MFIMPEYKAPDFTLPIFQSAPDAKYEPAERDGVVPDNFHSTSIYPEYFKINGKWKLAEESRMDSCVVLKEDGTLAVVEQRNVKKGELVITGRTERCEDGIYLHVNGFTPDEDKIDDQFVFRGNRSRETAYARDYQNLYDLLEYEKEHGKIVFVMGPACSFDYDSRKAMESLADKGYVHGLLAGNALATHDLEAGLLGTSLGQDIYTQKSAPMGHYHHLDVLNKVRRCGSIPKFIEEYKIDNGIIYSLVKNNIPFVLTSSIRDDGPLPEVIADAYEGQSAMRGMLRDATTIICLATQLHSIASGNMIPSFRVREGKVRPTFFYCVDISEFVTNKLHDRGSLSAVTLVTNVQDFVCLVDKGVK